MYTSDQAHHSVLKAALLAGILPERVRSVQSDARFRLDVAALERALRTPATGEGVPTPRTQTDERQLTPGPATD